MQGTGVGGWRSGGCIMKQGLEAQARLKDWLPVWCRSTRIEGSARRVRSTQACCGWRVVMQPCAGSLPQLVGVAAHGVVLADEGIAVVVGQANLEGVAVQVRAAAASRGQGWSVSATDTCQVTRNQSSYEPISS